MNATDRAVCIHGHFYQPPRESPWTGEIERQPSASPFHDWNARITSECYRPCLEAPVLDAQGQVVDRVDCWSHISFDVGPTLMRWLSTHARDVHDGIVQADRTHLARHGVGNAMAQGYHHTILPLCSQADRQTEIRWGLADFEARFGRKAEGFWLPEAAVDTPTLCALADEGIRYVVLAPGQAGEVEGTSDWQDATGIDTTVAYSVDLPGDRTMAAFFYDGPASQGVAFDGWLHDGRRMAHRLGQASSGLMHLATDGESYGHHHRHGEMALAAVIRTLEHLDVPLISYAAWLNRHPPRQRVRVVEQSSWSCSHGVGRWSEDCGCAIDPGRAGTHAWRHHVRKALNELRDRIDAFTHPRLARSGEDPQRLRDRYIEHLLAVEGLRTVDPFAGPGAAEVRALLEVQRHRLMMFTSCGWFFDDPLGLETTQILRYALRATELVSELGGPDLRAELERDLMPVAGLSLGA